MSAPSPSFVTRFAPSPNGYLHLGHAFSALTAYDAAQEAGGRFLLRVEDIDRSRARPEFEQAIYEDLGWLGISWEIPVRRQSDHFAEYAAALDRLEADDLLYPCFCTRKEIEAALDAPHGPTVVYPGTCRSLVTAERRERMEQSMGYARRLDLERTVELVGPLDYRDSGKTIQLDEATLKKEIGDVVLARKDIPASYHIAVVHDDALQGVTHVIRGEDLAFATPLHRLLQALLGLPTPEYMHHRLITDEEGKRFAKRDQSVTLRSLRESGVAPDQIRSRLA